MRAATVSWRSGANCAELGWAVRATVSGVVSSSVLGREPGHSTSRVAPASKCIWEKQQVKVGKRGGAVRCLATRPGIWGDSRSSVDSLGNAHLGDNCYLKLPFK